MIIKPKESVHRKQLTFFSMDTELFAGKKIAPIFSLDCHSVKTWSIIMTMELPIFCESEQVHSYCVPATSWQQSSWWDVLVTKIFITFFFFFSFFLLLLLSRYICNLLIHSVALSGGRIWPLEKCHNNDIMVFYKGSFKLGKEI